MSGFNLGKKLLPAKKAWKSFTHTFQSKLHKFKLRKAIKGAKKRCVIAFNYIRPLVSRNLYSFMRHNSSKHPPRRQFHYHYHQNKQSFPAIYIDELFQDSSVSIPTWYQRPEVVQRPKRGGEEKEESSSSGNSVKGVEEKTMRARKCKVGESSSNSNNNGDRWRLPSLPHFRGVDERAEEFISKFREEMKLQREQSILDYQEMLARAT